MRSLAITNDWDILIDDNGNFSFVEGNEELLQAACHAIYTFKGEDPFNQNAGIPYFEDILSSKTLSSKTSKKTLIQSYMRHEVKNIDGITNIYLLDDDFSKISGDFKSIIGITITNGGNNEL